MHSRCRDGQLPCQVRRGGRRVVDCGSMSAETVHIPKQARGGKRERALSHCMSGSGVTRTVAVRDTNSLLLLCTSARPHRLPRLLLLCPPAARPGLRLEYAMSWPIDHVLSAAVPVGR